MIPFKLHSFFQKVEEILPQISNKKACFDADGTLWKEDIGFSFLDYQKKHSLIKETKNVRELYKTNPTEACSLLLQANNNVSYEQYLSWCRDYLKTQPVNPFSFQKKILFFLKEKGVETYIVSSSPEWVVKTAVDHLKLPVDHVIGLKTLIKNNKVTDELYYPLPIAEGKTTAYLERSGNVYPFFSAGNTLADLDMLSMATHLRLAVASAPPGKRQYDSERVLQSLARQKSWMVKDFLNTEEK